MTDFSYLKKLVIPKIRALIDGLPFNTEGYGTSQTILRAKFGKHSEVANTNIHCIMSIQAITQTSAGKTLETVNIFPSFRHSGHRK